MDTVVISGTGICFPKDTITTQELADSYNRYASKYNQEFSYEIKAGIKEEIKNSQPEFIIQASGIRKRHVINKAGILNPDRMFPQISERNNSEFSLQCEMAIEAAKQALATANIKPNEINVVLCACSSMQRPYPAIAIEIQSALGCSGFAYDMNAACSSAVFALTTARSLLLSGIATCALVVTPELYTAHLNFKDRKSHFIFGDGCSATIIEKKRSCSAPHSFEILSSHLQTQFSNNIRNNFGFLNFSEQSDCQSPDKLFMQEGKKVREEVIPLAVKHISQHLTNLSIPLNDVKRLWLHQANIYINQAIAEQVLEHTPTKNELPSILDEYGNIGASGVMTVFHKYHRDLNSNDIGVLSAFGAGYAVGSLIVKKL